MAAVMDGSKSMGADQIQLNVIINSSKESSPRTEPWLPVCQSSIGVVLKIVRSALHVEYVILIEYSG